MTEDPNCPECGFDRYVERRADETKHGNEVLECCACGAHVSEDGELVATGEEAEQPAPSQEQLEKLCDRCQTWHADTGTKSYDGDPPEDWEADERHSGRICWECEKQMMAASNPSKERKSGLYQS